MKSKRKLLFGISAMILSGTMVFSAVLPNLQPSGNTLSANGGSEKGEVTDVTGSVSADLTQYFDSSVVEKLPEAVTGDQEISVILSLDTDTVLDQYHAADTDLSMGEYAASRAGKAVSASIEKQCNALLTKLSNAGVKYEVGNRFDTLLGGVEVTVKASAFDQLCNAVKGKAGVMVGEVYAPCETQVVENDVNVYDTGIFDSSDSEYDGTGTVIAVLDTGLDYTHTAFDPARFTTDTASDVITMDTLRTVIGQLEAAQTTPGLQPANVYLNRKVPYAYDYADGDDDVSPINNEHGTHVAGIMVGNDIDVNPEGIRGVAPNAQLAVMKTFSEKADGAKTSWIIAALEDCVKLKVDVINMSLGTAAGFSREVDEDIRYAVYDRIKEEGISLVAAASNNYNATFGSEKNGNLGLTSNPDSATVGAPSTYDAALSVASISGVKTPYLVYNGQIVYFTEASDSAAKPKDFVNEILAEGVRQGIVSAAEDTHEFEYVIIDGIGNAQQFVPYADGSLNGKIALVKRGQTNFEEKAGLARQYGAVGCIIFNNVSGDISMNVGRLGDFPVCSLSQVDGEMLQRGGNGKITISRSQKAGPFMSDFSSWGPTPDLRIKPEITAHGGDIYSAIPGQSYDRMSGTSMASPNQAGVTALVRQYVKDNFGFDGNDPATRQQIAATVNQIMMSTTDIATNKNGLPFSVRKQGSGLANLEKATHSKGYLQTFDRDTHEIMDKAKIELGDDPDKTGVYTMKFNIVNIGQSALSYDVSAVVMTEGVSEILTYKGDTTVTQEGYLLEGADISVTAVENCTNSDNKVTVEAGKTGTVTLTVTLSEENKKYIDSSFKNGMYVEGFVTLKANGTSYDLNAPFLAYYGSWHTAPMFDLDYFATNADELDDSKETLEKTLPDAYATRPVGGLYNDYISYLGSFPYLQDPNSTNKIAADRDHIALTNQTGEYGGINSINSVQLGLLRGAKRMVATVTDTSTGKVIFEKTQLNLSKSYNYGGAIYGSSFDVDFNLADYDLKNNTKYIFRLTGYIDYEDGSVSNNTFEFPFYTDFTAPIVTGVEYTYEYDRDSETNRLFANISVYDNHYVRGLVPGYIGYSDPGASAPYTIYGFGQYVVPVIGERNSTSVVQIELTDYLQQIKDKSYNNRSFMVQLMDCAQNTSTFELTIPDNIVHIDFKEEEIRISPNEIYILDPNITPTEDEAWKESINYTTDDESIARVVNGKLIGIKSGDVTLTATSNRNANAIASVKVHVKSPDEPDYKSFDRPIAENFRLTGYVVNKVYYFLASEDRDLGASEAGTTVHFTGSTYSLKMLPSESVTIEYDLRGYFDEKNYKVEFTSSKPSVVEVEPDTGKITAKNVNDAGEALNSERTATISVRLLMLDPETGEYKPTITTRTIFVTVKAPYETNGPYLMGYKGLGGKVVIPEDLGITEIQQFAFSNYDLVPKDLSAGDEITEEDPYYSKQWYIGDNTITEVVIPEGVKTIGMYAFANLTALRSITLPSTLTKIQTGAFIGCTSLVEVKFNKNNLQFINQRAFEGCSKLASFDFSSIVAIGDAAFMNTRLISVQLPATTQSIGAAAFAGTGELKTVTIAANKIKVGAQAFAGCAVSSMEINASVFPAQIFLDCTNLTRLKLGADVEVIGEYSLRGTRISRLEVDANNSHYEAAANGKYLLEKGTGVLALVAPTTVTFTARDVTGTTITKIGSGAFSAAASLTSVNLPSVTEIGDYAFAECSALGSAQFGTLKSVGNYAFFGTSLRTLPAFETGISVGERAFSMTGITTADVPAEAEIGSYAFAQNYNLTTVTIGNGAELEEGAFFASPALATVTIGNDVVLGDGAFSAIDMVSRYGDLLISGNTFTYNQQSVPTSIDPYISALTNLTIGDNVTIGNYAFQGVGSGRYSGQGQSGQIRNFGAELRSVSLGENVTIGAYAFNGCHYLSNIDLSHAAFIGDYAFSGQQAEYVLFDTGLMVVRINPYGAAFAEADLSGLDPEASRPLGDGVFAYSAIKRVQLPETLTAIGNSAFLECTELAEINLSNATLIGNNAFAGTALTSVDLAEGASLGNGAFEGCTQLAAVGNLETAVQIGARALKETALTSADLSAAVAIGDFAFADSALTSVKLGEKLGSLGENPFAGCKIGDFTNASGNTTFDVNAAVKVIDGVLYASCPNGYELITYPMEKAGKYFTVAKNVVRIGAEAFRGAELSAVEISRRVAAIGDKAFYGCDNLIAVTFTSIQAPILEEQYDTALEGNDENGRPLYLTNNFAHYIDVNNNEHGLRIVPYQIWNADPTCVLQGATFVAEIGTAEGRSVLAAKSLVMVRPINGTGYENFIFEQYFDLILDGRLAISDDAQTVIDMIEALPESVTLDDRATVEQIRALYNALPADQQGCVFTDVNYSKLEAAENRIAYLLAEEEKNKPQPSEPTGIPYLWAYIVAGVVAVAAVVAVVLIVLLKKKNTTSEEEESETAEEKEGEPEAGGPNDVPETETGEGTGEEETSEKKSSEEETEQSSDEE